MGTRADFYVGRGKSAEWIGSIAMDGYPSGIAAKVKSAATEAEYRAAVAAFFADRNDATRPADGWPWPWNDSGTTNYTYAFDGEAVYASNFGYGWRKAKRLRDDVEFDESKTAEFPDMSAVKKVTMGPRSGLMVFTGPKS